MNSIKYDKIYMRPAWLGDNTFTHSLADALIDCGLEVIEVQPNWRGIPNSPGIVFLHWPDEFFYRKNTRLAIKAIIAIIRLRWASTIHNQKLVWLVHNLQPHDGKGKNYFLVKSLFLNSLSGVVFLSNSSKASFSKVYKNLAELPSAVIRHGHYKNDAVSPPTLPSALKHRRILAKYVGRIKKYKSPDILARAALPIPERVELHIVGEMHDKDLRKELEYLEASASNIILDIKPLPLAEFESEIDAADVIVVAYRDILNSGSALYALSRNRPFIGPRLGSLLELQQDVGRDWIWLYDGELTSEVFAEAIRWVSETDRSTPPDLSNYSWPNIGRELSRFFKTI